PVRSSGSSSRRTDWPITLEARAPTVMSARPTRRLPSQAERHRAPALPVRWWSPRFAAPRRAGGSRAAPLGLGFVEHCAGGGAAFLTQFVAVLGAPVVGLGARPVVAAEMRHYVALIQFVGAFGFLPIGPVVGLLQKDAEFALLCLQPLDQCDCV